MPNPSRFGFQFRSAGCPSVWDLQLKATIGVDGAATLVALNSIGITSITRSDVGEYVIVLNNGYSRLLGVRGTFIAAGGSTVGNVCVSDDSVEDKELTILCMSGGVAVDPAPGEVMLLEISVKNSSVAAG